MSMMGSKLSIISNADVRYEGILCSVDAEQYTFAMKNVRCFGTEHRSTEYPVPSQSIIYEFIMFRGRSIKEIRVVDKLTQPLDPAIMQAVPQNGQMPNIPTPNMNLTKPISLSTLETIYSLKASDFGAQASSLTTSTDNLGPHKLGENQQLQPEKQQKINMPVSTYAKSDSKIESDVKSREEEKEQQNRNKGKSSRNTSDTEYEYKGHQQSKQNKINDYSPKYYHRGSERNLEQNRKHVDNQCNRKEGDGSRAVGETRTSRMHRGHEAPKVVGKRGDIERGHIQKQRFGGYQNQLHDENINPFEKDFDFEQGNNLFEKLSSELKQLKVDDEHKTDRMNGKTDEHEPKKEVFNEAYDKKKSFFDKISYHSDNKESTRRQPSYFKSDMFGASSKARGRNSHN